MYDVLTLHMIPPLDFLGYSNLFFGAVTFCKTKMTILEEDHENEDKKNDSPPTSFFVGGTNNHV